MPETPIEYYRGIDSGFGWWLGCYLGYAIATDVSWHFEVGAILSFLFLLQSINAPVFETRGTFETRIVYRLRYGDTTTMPERSSRDEFERMVTRFFFITCIGITLVVGSSFYIGDSVMSAMT